MGLVAVVLSGLLLMPAQAMQLSPMLELNPSNDQIRLELKNDSHLDQEYILSSQETTFPGKARQVLDAKGSKLIFSPARLRLKAGQSGVFKLHYKGPRDQEHYFRLLVEEQGKNSKEASGVSARFPLQIASSLIVRPLHPKLAYVLEGEQLRNTGNGYLLMMQDEDCGKQKGMTAFVAPGKAYPLPEQSGKSILSVGMIDEIKVVRSQCSRGN